ncbi:MAG TPA: benzoyl-CoA-dihydrodiol lyase [Blastocatellia bacterium]|nr:benzoyl-CoA-dihydrodiol lyase [Blastocatellia bacterium]HAF24264.1 benzoyl-CoA-dihydrodiol lyase [Blastocatellia bacterium]HCX29687.1 benzoyl-CoA-dihydrodiol lyase [Blastocatellia bacterium]
MINFQTSPDQYKHWRLSVDGPVATLSMDVQEDVTLAEGYKLKLNSYDLGVDIELADAIQRLRFEHPQVKAVVITSLKPRIFCAGANIYMLGTSSHAFKVNFCKFTNETRCAIEDDSRHSGRRYIAALNGTASGGGYELAIACDEIYLVDDGNSAISLPEVPLLGVLPGTGGLTRLVDKRKVRRDRADVFSTLAEGLKGKRAKEWGLIDDYFPTSKFQESINARVSAIVQEVTQTVRGPQPGSPAGALDSLRNDAETASLSDSDAPQTNSLRYGIKLNPLEQEVKPAGVEYKYVNLILNREQRYADLTVHGPEAGLPTTTDEIEKLGDAYWPLQAFRELDDALLHLRVNEPEIGLVCIRTAGNIDDVLAVDQALAASKDHWLVREILLYMARVLRRLDLTAKSFFAIVEPGSCFAGSLLELLLASDRSYMLNNADEKVAVTIGELNGGALPMSNGLTRLQSRFLARPETVEKVLAHQGSFDAEEAEEAGLITFVPDELDWEDEIRVAIEERTSLSPDALTGMEASLRFAGPETMDTKIYGRLTAWQNWIFQRPNAVGPEGALTNYGKPTQAHFDFKRT